jgi:hypothetical protein
LRKRIGNDHDEKEKKRMGRRKRSFVIHTIWDCRSAMSTLLNEIRNNEWDCGQAREQRCCIESIADFIKVGDLETKLAEIEVALKQAQGSIRR